METECSGNMYSCMEMKKNETCWNYSRNGGRGGQRTTMEGVNSTMKCCQSFCNCDSVPHYMNTTIRNKN
jgi:hypothetical protein